MDYPKNQKSEFCEKNMLMYSWGIANFSGIEILLKPPNATV